MNSDVLKQEWLRSVLQMQLKLLNEYDNSRSIENLLYILPVIYGGDDRFYAMLSKIQFTIDDTKISQSMESEDVQCSDIAGQL